MKPKYSSKINEERNEIFYFKDGVEINPNSIDDCWREVLETLAYMENELSKLPNVCENKTCKMYFDCPAICPKYPQNI